MGVVLVTGCRSGFGLCTAVEAGRRGHVVYAGLRDLQTADGLREAASGLDVRPVQLDVTSAAERAAVITEILAKEGRLDALVNNAGVALGGFLEQLDEDELRHVFEVNVMGVWAMTQAVLPTMRAQRSGTVVMVSSMSGRMALPCLGAYAASKFALEGLSEAWRHELSPLGVRVVLVEPGAYKTDIFGRNRHFGRHAREPGSVYAGRLQHLDRLFERMVNRQSRPPEAVADKICDLIAERRPKLRHPMGSDAHLRSALLRVLPFVMVEALVARLTRQKPQRS